MKTVRPQTILLALPAALALGLVAPHARADVLLNNLDQPARGTTILGTEDPDMIWAAQSFRTPGRASLNIIKILAGNAVNSPDVVIALYAGTDPSGTLLTTFAIPAFNASGLNIVDLVPDSAVVLKPGTLYWLVVGTATTGSVGWSYAEGNASDGPGSFGPYNYSTDSGATWPASGSDNPYHMQIEATPIACPADFNGDGFVTGDDFDAYVLEFVNGNDAADFNGDSFVTGDDYDAFVEAFEAGC